MTTVPACVVHPERPALSVCRRCGNFTCVECNPDGATPCPSCRALTGSRFTRGPLPWERRGELGVLTALWLQTKETILEPGRVFATMDPNGTTWDAVSYAWLVSAFATIVQIPYQALNWWLQAGQLDNGLFSPDTKMPEGFEALMAPLRWLGHHPWLAALGFAVFALVAMPFGVLLQAVFSHLGAMALGFKRADFSATLRSVAYAQAPSVLMAIPIVGGFAGLYVYALEVWALRDAHEGTTGKALLATVWPLVLALCCGCLGVLAAVALAVSKL